MSTPPVRAVTNKKKTSKVKRKWQQKKTKKVVLPPSSNSTDKAQNKALQSIDQRVADIAAGRVVQFAPRTLNWLECMFNPAANDLRNGVDTFTQVTPNSSNNKRCLLRATSSTSFSGATGPVCYVFGYPITYTSGYCIETCAAANYGAATYLTSSNAIPATEWTLFNALVGSTVPVKNLVTLIKVNVGSTGAYTAADIRSGFATLPPRTNGTPVYLQNADYDGLLRAPRHPGTEGRSLKRVFEDTDTFACLGQYSYGTDARTPFPFFRVENLGTTDTVRATVYSYYEANFQANSSIPWALPDPLYEPNWHQIGRILDDLRRDDETTGHSFKSFAKKLLSGVALVGGLALTAVAPQLGVPATIALQTGLAIADKASR